MQMWAGNMVAWLAFIFLIVSVGLLALFGIVWWKLPQPAKKLFLNNLRGGRPIVADAYDNKMVKFETPRIFREGIMHDKESGWHFIPRLTKDADQKLSIGNQAAITSAFSIQGAAGKFYLAYSGKGTVVNPEIQAVIEHNALFKKKGNPDGCVHVPKEALINALNKVEGDTVQIKPVWITALLDPRKIKHYLSKAYSKSQLLAQEIEITDAIREQYQGSLAKITAFMGLISLVVLIVVAAKQFGLF